MSVQIDELVKAHDKINILKNRKRSRGEHIDAQYELAVLYYNGERTEKNLAKAFYWFQKAAENCYENAHSSFSFAES
jgi:TPR repeat protein